MLRILKYALLTGLVTLVMGVVASFVFPVEVDLESIGIAQPPKVERKPYYTKEEMDQADREGEELLRQVKKKLNEQKAIRLFSTRKIGGLVANLDSVADIALCSLATPNMDRGNSHCYSVLRNLIRRITPI